MTVHRLLLLQGCVKRDRRWLAAFRPTLVRTVSFCYARAHDYGEQSLQVSVERELVVRSTVLALAQCRAQEITIKDFQVHFVGESGADAGGLTREWLKLFFDEVFDEDRGLFRLHRPSGRHHPNPLSLSHSGPELLFRTIGKLAAKSLLLDIPLGVRFTNSFLKHLLKQPLALTDLEDLVTARNRP